MRPQKQIVNKKECGLKGIFQSIVLHAYRELLMDPCLKHIY